MKREALGSSYEFNRASCKTQRKLYNRPDGTTPAERFFESKYDDFLNNFLSRAV
jgi:hypothetical protein